MQLMVFFTFIMLMHSDLIISKAFRMFSDGSSGKIAVKSTNVLSAFVLVFHKDFAFHHIFRVILPWYLFQIGTRNEVAGNS